MASVLGQCQCPVPNLHSIASPSSCPSLSPKQSPKTRIGLLTSSGASPLVSYGRFELSSPSGEKVVCLSSRKGGGSRAAGDASSRRDFDSTENISGWAPVQLQRRGFVGRLGWASIVLPVLMTAGSSASGVAAAAAAAEEEGEEVQVPEPATTPDEPAKPGLVERLLERSKANKARYTQERLDDYYRRNFKDYFGFLKGGLMDKDKDKLTEAEKGILNWLEKNQ